MIYSTLIYTGLRKSKLASLTLAQAILEEEMAYLIVRAGDEKAKRGVELPLYSELASVLRFWVDEFHFPPGRANRPIKILKRRGIHHSHAIYRKPQAKSSQTQINSRPVHPATDGLGECLPGARQVFV